jgi:hypothetical protein
MQSKENSTSKRQLYSLDWRTTTADINITAVYKTEAAP